MTGHVPTASLATRSFRLATLLMCLATTQASAFAQGTLIPGNALRQRPAGGGDQRTVAPAQPRRAVPAGDLQFEVLQVYDRMVDNVAFRMLIPAGWKAEGGIVWRPNASNLAVSGMFIHDPTERMGLFLYPTDAFCYSNSLAQYGFRTGSNYLGNEVLYPIERVSDYVAKVVLPRYRPDVRASIVSTSALPEVANAVKAAIAEQGMQKVVLAAKVRIEYVFRGVPTEEDIFCTLTYATTPANPGFVLWGPERLYSFAAPKGQLDGMTPVFQAMATSTAVDLGWYNKYQQVWQMWYQRMQQSIRDAGALSRYIAQINDEISEMIVSSYEHRQRVMDRVNRQFSKYIRGVDDYHSPHSNYPVQLPSGYDSAWVSETGEYYLSDTRGFNPNEHSTHNWTRLRPAR